MRYRSRKRTAAEFRRCLLTRSGASSPETDKSAPPTRDVDCRFLFSCNSSGGPCRCRHMRNGRNDRTKFRTVGLILVAVASNAMGGNVAAISAQLPDSSLRQPPPNTRGGTDFVLSKRCARRPGRRSTILPTLSASSRLKAVENASAAVASGATTATLR